MVGCVPVVKNFWSTIFSSRRYTNIKVGGTTSFNNTISRPKPTPQLDDEYELMGLSHAHDSLPAHLEKKSRMNEIEPGRRLP
jgi:hypothetical protein